MKNILKKSIFYITGGVSCISLLLALLYGLNPEWFQVLEGLFGLNSTTWQNILTTLGFGGTVGTASFAVMKSHIASTNNNVSTLNEKTLSIVVDKLKETLSYVETKFKELQTKYSVQSENIVKTMVLLTNYANKVFDLEYLIRNMIDLEKLNLNKTLANPLVNEETKKLIHDGLESLKKEEA